MVLEAGISKVQHFKMPVCTIKRKEILDTISLLQKQDNFKCHNFTVTVEDLLRPEVD